MRGCTPELGLNCGMATSQALGEGMGPRADSTMQHNSLAAGALAASCNSPSDARPPSPLLRVPSGLSEVAEYEAAAQAQATSSASISQVGLDGGARVAGSTPPSRAAASTGPSAMK